MKEFTAFEAILKPLTKELLAQSVKAHDSDYYSKRFKTYDHLVALLYAQLHDVKSLRDLEIAFNSQDDLRTLLDCSSVSRSTLSDANARRPSECFLWIAHQLMTLLPKTQQRPINKVVRKLDSSPIQLKGRHYNDWTLGTKTLRCQGIKLHVEYDHEVNAPTRIELSPANVNDSTIGQHWPILSDTVYVFDKGYYDFNWWWSIHEKNAFFVTRLKKNVAITPILSNIGGDETILEDQLFLFKNKTPRGGKRNAYQTPLRRISVKRQGKEPIVLVTNLVHLPAEAISQLYKERWEIELFFKWVKQNLRIKRFLGTSENAVKTQIAVALILYLLLALFNLAQREQRSLHQLLIWVRHNYNRICHHFNLFKPPESYCIIGNNNHSGIKGG